MGSPRPSCTSRGTGTARARPARNVPTSNETRVRVDAFHEDHREGPTLDGFLPYSPRRIRSARSNSANQLGAEKSGIARKSRWRLRRSLQGKSGVSAGQKHNDPLKVRRQVFGHFGY